MASSVLYLHFSKSYHPATAVATQSQPQCTIFYMQHFCILFRSSSGIIATFSDKTGGNALWCYRLFLPFSYYLLCPLPRTIPNSEFTSVQTRWSIESWYKGRPHWSALASQSELKKTKQKKANACLPFIPNVPEKGGGTCSVRIQGLICVLHWDGWRWNPSAGIIKVLEHFLISSFYSLR